MKKREVESVEELCCPVCRKTYVPAPYHVYRIGNRLVCSWSCLCRARKEGIAKVKGRPSRPVLQMDKAGKVLRRFASVMEASVATGAEAGRIRNACRSGGTAGGFLWEYVYEETGRASFVPHCSKQEGDKR